MAQLFGKSVVPLLADPSGPKSLESLFAELADSSLARWLAKALTEHLSVQSVDLSALLWVQLLATESLESQFEPSVGL